MKQGTICALALSALFAAAASARPQGPTEVDLPLPPTYPRGVQRPIVLSGPGALRIPPDTPPPPPVRFAVIGDYGIGNADEADVAALVHSLPIDFVITAGDNNYPVGGADTIDDHIGLYYHDYIQPYLGAHGVGAADNRFFPALGNHDWLTTDAQPYLDYFTLPGNERYYDFVRGPVHFFAVDSDPKEPDGVVSSSVQATWLRDALAASGAPFKVVYMHHAPYSSSSVHGSVAYMQWPYAAWGADAVIAGHDHLYERIVTGGLTYFVNGCGGAFPYAFGTPVSGSQFGYSGHGAMLVEATAAAMTIQFLAPPDTVLDWFTIPWGGLPDTSGTPTALVPQGAQWRFLDDGSQPGSGWRNTPYDDSGWSVGPAELGYGDGDEATLVAFGRDPNDKHVTTWFRHTFAVAQPWMVHGLLLRVLRDDGAAVYLNGQQVFRSNLPYHQLGPQTLAPLALTASAESTFFETWVDETLLRRGLNTLAVEIHQADPADDDLSFDLELLGY